MTIAWVRDCLSVAATAMIPISEIFGSVPLGLVLGLDPVSIVLSSTVGNLTVALILEVFYKALRRVPRIRVGMERAEAGKIAARLRRSGYAVLWLFTPLIGIYLSTVIARGLGMPFARTFPVMWISVCAYCVAMVLAAQIPWPTGSP